MVEVDSRKWNLSFGVEFTAVPESGIEIRPGKICSELKVLAFEILYVDKNGRFEQPFDLLGIGHRLTPKLKGAVHLPGIVPVSSG